MIIIVGPSYPLQSKSTYFRCIKRNHFEFCFINFQSSRLSTLGHRRLVDLVKSQVESLSSPLSNQTNRGSDSQKPNLIKINEITRLLRLGHIITRAGSRELHIQDWRARVARQIRLCPAQLCLMYRWGASEDRVEHGEAIYHVSNFDL